MTDSSSTMPPARTPDLSRRLRWLALAILLGIAVLSAGWFVYARLVENGVREAIAGSPVHCTDLQAAGYPFRIGITCSKAGFAQDGVIVETLNLRTAAQIYNPSLLIGEVDSPVNVSLADGRTMSITFEKARASVRSGGMLPERASTEMASIAVTGLPGSVAADGIEAHVRKGAENRIDAAASAIAVKAGGAPQAELAFDASMAGTSRLEAAIGGGGDWRAALRGGEGELRSASLQFAGGGRIVLSGPFVIAESGLVSGAIRFAIDDGAALGPALADFAAALGLDAAPVAGLIANAGSGASEITVTIRDGAMSVGFIPLGNLPPL
jgi:hypothetical protein